MSCLTDFGRQVKTSSPLSPVLNGQYQTRWNANQDYMENASLFYIAFQVLRRYFCEKLLNTATSHFISCFTSVFMSADISFYNILELHSTLPEKDFCPNFSLFNGLTQTPPLHPINGQNLLSVTKCFRQLSLKWFLKFFSKICWQNPARASFMYQQ